MMFTLITYLMLGSSPLTLSFRALNCTQKSGKSYFSGKYHVKFGHFVRFHNPVIPGLKHRQSRGSGLRKWSGIPGFGIPGLESLVMTLFTYQDCVIKRSTNFINPDLYCYEDYFRTNPVFGGGPTADGWPGAMATGCGEGSR